MTLLTSLPCLQGICGWRKTKLLKCRHQSWPHGSLPHLSILHVLHFSLLIPISRFLSLLAVTPSLTAGCWARSEKAIQYIHVLGSFWQLVTSNLKSLMTIQPEFLLLLKTMTCSRYSLNVMTWPLLARPWRSKSPVTHTMYLAQSLRKCMDLCSSAMKMLLLGASLDHLSIPFQENPLSQGPSRVPLDGNFWYGEVVFLSQWPDALPQASSSSLGHIVCFSLWSCEDCCIHSTPRSEHRRQWADGFHAVGRAQLTALSHPLEQSQTESQADPFPHLCYIYS